MRSRRASCGIWSAPRARSARRHRQNSVDGQRPARNWPRRPTSKQSRCAAPSVFADRVPHDTPALAITAFQPSEETAMKLYYAPGACSIGIHVLLEEIGKPYETQIVKLMDGEQYKPPFTGINPKSKVPTVQRDAGSHP